MYSIWGNLWQDMNPKSLGDSTSVVDLVVIASMALSWAVSAPSLQFSWDGRHSWLLQTSAVSTASLASNSQLHLLSSQRHTGWPPMPSEIWVKASWLCNSFKFHVPRTSYTWVAVRSATSLSSSQDYVSWSKGQVPGFLSTLNLIPRNTFSMLSPFWNIVGLLLFLDMVL